MVLNREENKSLRILLKEGLVGFLSLNARGSSLGLLLLGLLNDLCLQLGGIGGLVERLVFLVGGTEVELFDRGLHVEVLNCGSSLLIRNVSEEFECNCEPCHIPASKESFAQPLCYI
jgi:hypothetical protein